MNSLPTESLRAEGAHGNTEFSLMGFKSRNPSRRKSNFNTV